MDLKLEMNEGFELRKRVESLMDQVNDDHRLAYANLKYHYPIVSNFEQ